MNDLKLHAHLIGQQGSRRALNSPVLVIDHDALQRNIQTMAAFAKARGVTLRPHAKTHKSAHIARLQIHAGAVGICCAKLGEAEALAEEGDIESILITSPVVSAPAIARLLALHEKIPALAVVADNPDNVDALATANRTSKPLALYVDIDPGIRRTGVGSPEAARDLALRIQSNAALAFAGVQFYCGMHQHIAEYADRRAGIEERTDYLRSVIACLTDAGAPPAVITGGGTGTHRIDADLGVFNELQVGSYVFMDRQYNDCALTEAGDAPFETSLMVDARIVSANTPGMATIDAGFKAFAADGGPPTIVSGAPLDAKYHFMGDEHGAIVAPGTTFTIGEQVVLTTPHCDPTVNLYDAFHIVRGDTLVDIWPVTARGRSR